MKFLKSRLNKLAILVAATLSIGSAFALDTALTCRVNAQTWDILPTTTPLYQNPPPYTSTTGSTDYSSTIGTDERGANYEVRVDINRHFGGVGVAFWIKGVNILESRAAGGAGWQTTSVIRDTSNPTYPRGRYILFNQGAGNTKVSQWGYHNNYYSSSSGISALDYNPIWADDWFEQDHDDIRHPVGPCPVANSLFFDYGKLQIAMAAGQTSGHGRAVMLTNQITYQSQFNQTWGNWSAQQALHLDKTMARNGGLKIYLKGKFNGWRETIDPFNIQSGHNSGLCATNNTQCADWMVVSPTRDDRLEYALLVWNIFGQEFGLAIVGPPQNTNGFRANLKRQDGTFGDPNPGKECDPAKTNPSPSQNDRCGVIEWHTYMQDTPNTSFVVNQERSLKTDYRVGTIQQLADWGYTKQ